MNVVRQIHRDQKGSISIVSVFALLLLVGLLGLVMNTSRAIDAKVRMQNAADAVAWSGGAVLTRHMNELAYTNHLMADTFALTAFMREARDRNAETYITKILEAWRRIGPFLSTSEYPPFAELGSAITEKNPLEDRMVRTFSDWAAAASEPILPVLETILAEDLIPKFQRSLTVASPALVQNATLDMARRHGQGWPRPAPLVGILWRTTGDAVGGPTETTRRVLPVVDPDPQFIDGFVAAEDHAGYIRAAVEQRRGMAHAYLAEWNAESLRAFDRYGKMSQFSNLWRIFTCGYLKHLLEVEYPLRNLPFQLRRVDEPPSTQNDYVERDFMFVGVVYRERPRDFIPRLFRNPSQYEQQAFAQVSMFVPQRRLIRVRLDGTSMPQGESLGGVPGDTITLPPAPYPTPPPPAPDAEPVWRVVRQSASWNPDRWSLTTENWHLQLVPATARNLQAILSTDPRFEGRNLNLLVDWTALAPGDFHTVTHH